MNGKLFNTQFNKLKSGIKNGTEVTLSYSSNVISDSVPHKVLLIDTKVLRARKAFENDLSPNIKFLKIRLCRMVQFGGSKTILELPQLAWKYFIKNKEHVEKNYLGVLKDLLKFTASKSIDKEPIEKNNLGIVTDLVKFIACEGIDKASEII